MEHTKLLTFAVIGLLVLNFLTLGFLILKPNRPLRPGGPYGAQEPASIISQRLHFDPGQQATYRQLISQHQEQTRILNEQMTQLYRDYYDLLTMTSADSMRAVKLTQQIADNQQTQAQLNFDHFKQIKSLCRPDQQADFTRLVSDLARLFGRQQRPPRPGADGPPNEPDENLLPHP